MDTSNFLTWLQNMYDDSTSKSRLLNCRRIEQFGYLLDEEYDKDDGNDLLRKLTYTKQDKRSNASPLHKIPINGDIYNGTATLKQAAKLYFKFRDHFSDIDTTDKKPKREPPKKKSTSKLNTWPTWEIPSDDDLYNLIMLLSQYSKFLHPDIVEKIVNNNKQNFALWSDELQRKGINPEIYLWDASPCAFPGVRRYAGSEEIAVFRKQKTVNKNIPNALALDDNDFPKHIWAFTFTGKEFRKKGPDNYSLAHLADHKEYKNRKDEDFIKVVEQIDYPLFGLYTSPCNTVYLPEFLLKPTDFSKIIRHIFIKKAQSLYGNICNIIPPWLDIKDNSTRDWTMEDFSWPKPVGDCTYLDKFLEYRFQKMKVLLGK